MLWILSWRNLWRNRRRTLLTMSAISLGLAVLITMVSFMEGMFEMMTEQIAKSSIGHIQLHHPDYLEKKTNTLVMGKGSELTRIVEGTPGVVGVSPRLIFSGSIRSSRSSTVRVVQILAVDPEREGNFSVLPSKVAQGAFVAPPPESLDPNAPARQRDRKGITIGRKLAEQLKVGLGSKVRVDCAGFQGATTAAAFYVTGILDTGTDAFDKNMALVSLVDMQEVTGADDTIHELTVMAVDDKALDELVSRIDGAIAAAGIEGMGPVQTLPWYGVMPEMKQMLDLSGAWSGVLYLLMMVVLSAGILTTMFMVVYERRREFGVQLALGTRPGNLFLGVMLEALFIAALASVAGLVVGAFSVAYVATKGIDLSVFMEGFEFAGAFIDNVYRGAATPKVFIEPTVVVFIGTVIFALWPALKVARMKALDAIRQTGAAR
jgi:ABC-type lipoprotein release transport system permease subunit